MFTQRSVLHLILALLVLGFAPDASATRYVPPTIEQVVDGAEQIGLVSIQAAEVYRVADSEGEFRCGYIYRGNWVDSLSGDAGPIEFVHSRPNLEIDSLYLVFLATEPLRRRMMSTSSWAEEARQRREEREQLCTRSKDLPQTIFTPTRLHKPMQRLRGEPTLWVDEPKFFRSTLNPVWIYPTEYKIDGRDISQEDLFTEFEHGEHDAIQSPSRVIAGLRSVAWSEYCALLSGLADRKFRHVRPRRLGPFCEPGTWAEAARW